MSDDSDTGIQPKKPKGKRKTVVLSDSSSDSDSSSSTIALPKRNGKRKNRIRESDSDSSIDKPRKLKKPRVPSDSEKSSADSEIVRNKKLPRIVSDESESSSSGESDAGSDNGFEDESSEGWESDWVSETGDMPEDNHKLTMYSTSSQVATENANVESNFSDSSDGNSEKCPICLLSFNDQEVGSPETCDHSFCADCIQEWSKNVNTCPVDRQTFTLILVRRCYDGKVIRRVPVDVRRPSVEDLIQEDPTYCEICGMSDREDRLLLCDGCDLGYHLECLDPPLETVPVEEWFCTECRLPSLLHDQPSQSPEGSRNYQSRRFSPEQRLVPRTSQSERVRAQIANNRNALLNHDQASLSSGFESVVDVSIPGTSRTNNNLTINHSSRNSRTIRRKTKKRKSRKRRLGKILYYDICEITGNKIAVRKKTRRRKYKKKKKKKSTRRVIMPKTAKKRLAVHLGMCPPKKLGQAIPEVKVRTHVHQTNSIGFQRSQAGIPTLHLFGQRDQLDYFSGTDEDITIADGGVNILSRARTTISEASALRRTARRKAGCIPMPITAVNSCDILSTILTSQENFHSKNSVLSINRDGTINIENKNTPENNNEIIIKPVNDNLIPSEQTIDLTNVDIETTQTPMFPGRGGGGNRQPYGFNRGGGYRSGGGNMYDSGPHYNYQGGSRGRGGYNQGPMYNNPRDNFGYANYHSNHGGPPPFRGRSGPRFPMRRPQLHQPQRIIEPVELNLEEPLASNSGQDNRDRPVEEDVDIYSDIEALSPTQDEPPPTVKSPLRDLQPAPIPDANFPNSGTEDEDSDQELVIDDTVKESDKYDPADPSNDTDSNSQPAIKSLETEKIDDSMDIPVQIVQINKSETSESSGSTSKIPNVTSKVVNEVVQQVLQEHLGKTKMNTEVITNEDDFSDEDCPNFSIYSAESIDIAKATEIDIPKNVDEPEQVEDSNKTSEAMEQISDFPEEEEEDDEEDTSVSETKENEIKTLTEELKSLTEEIKSATEKMFKEDVQENKADITKFPEDEKIELNINDDNENNKNINNDEPKEDINEMEIKKIIDDTGLDETLDDNTIKNIEEEESHKTDDELFKENDETVKEIEEIVNKELREDLCEESVPLAEDKEDDIDQKENKCTDSEFPDALKSSSTESLPENKKIEKTSVKIAFDPQRRAKPVEQNKSLRVLQLYDDSDLEEWESKNELDKVLKSMDTNTNAINELEKMTEAISEEERSYTPCLDEKEPNKSHYSDDEQNIGAGIGGMDTEMISDDERTDMFDESHDMKIVSDGDALEINAKESELELGRTEDYEEGEIVEKTGVKKAKPDEQEQPEKLKEPAVEKDETPKPQPAPRKKDKEAEKENRDKNKDHDKSKKTEFKKLSKNNKERNYREKDKEKSRAKSQDRKVREDKENKKDKKKERKRDLERYNVRSLIQEKPRKDQFGRDEARPNRSRSRSFTPLTPRRSASRSRRSHSYDRSKKRRKRSRSFRRSRSRSASRGYSRSRSRGRSLRRSRSPRRSRTPRRSRSNRRSKSPRNKKARVAYRSSSRDRSYKKQKSKERIKSKRKNRSTSKTRVRSHSPSFTGRHRTRDWERRQSYGREWTPSWSRSPSPRPLPRHTIPQSMSPSWTPPLALDKGPVQPENLTVILTNNEATKNKKKEKKKKSEKKTRDDIRKRKRVDRTPPPSKEVFASGDNILVSVSFNKTGDENPAREVMGGKRRRQNLTEPVRKKKEKNKEKKKRASSPKSKRKKNKEVANMKPVAIIDLDRSPFKEITPSPKDVIVLSDSDMGEKGEESMSHNMQEEMAAMEAQNQEISAPQSPNNYMNSTGPKTPPEPQVKFLLSSKQNQIRAITNPLHDPSEEQEVDIDPQEELENRLNDVLHKGPNTPPEPPTSPPSSPDAYDPFDPTKSRSPTPEPANIQTMVNSNATEKKPDSETDLVDLAVGPLENSQKSNDSTEKRASPGSNGLQVKHINISVSPELSTQALRTPPVVSESTQTPDAEVNKNDLTDKAKSPERNAVNVVIERTNTIGVVINQQVQHFPAVVKPIVPTAVYSSSTPSVITSTPIISNTSLPRTNLFNTPTLMSAPRTSQSAVPQRIVLPTSSKSSPAKMSPAKPPIKSTPIKPMQSSKTMISKLPVPNVKPITPIRKGNVKSTNNRSQNGNEVIDVDLDFESPYSPGSSDYEDLFEPPQEANKSSSNNRQQQKTKSPAKGQNVFDALFGSASPPYRPTKQNTGKQKLNSGKNTKSNKKTTPSKHASNKTHVGVKLDEDNLKILDDLPNSAVEMQVKDKFLKKLNRQERVVEEVKLVLKPHYNKKHITKEQYKDILRRSVPKICHNRSGEINPKKIQNLIEAYVKKARHNKKLSTNTSSAAPAQQTKPAKTTFWS